MMQNRCKIVYVLSAVLFFLSSCRGSKEDKWSMDEDALEIEVINQTVSIFTPREGEVIIPEIPADISNEQADSILKSYVQQKRAAIDSSGWLLFLYDSLYCPGDSYLYLIEAELGLDLSSFYCCHSKKLAVERVMDYDSISVLSDRKKNTDTIRTIGTVAYSRMFFSSDYKTVYFFYTFHPEWRFCTHQGISYFVSMKKIGGVWGLRNVCAVF